MLPLATSTWDEQEYSALQEVIQSGVFTMGQSVSSFESLFADYIGTRYAVMVNSGSSANLIAVAALFFRKSNSLKPGDEVIVPAVSWSTTYYPLHQYGLKIKFVDIDQSTLNIDLNALATAITEKTRAIFAVNLLGNPIDYLALKSLLLGRDIILIEDNCESLGATYQGKQAGSFGVMGTFSTFFSHHISTMEGGLVVTDDEELYHIMLSLRAHGWTRHLPVDNRICKKSNNSFEESFRFILPGYNLRPLELSGALGIKQLEKLPKIIKGRRENGLIFQDLFSSIPNLRIQQEIGESSWFGFALIIKSGRKKRDYIVKNFIENKIDCRPIVAGNFVKNPVIHYFDYKIHKSLKNADYIHDCGFFIGNHHYNIGNELSVVASLIRELLAEESICAF